MKNLPIEPDHSLAVTSSGYTHASQEPTDVGGRIIMAIEEGLNTLGALANSGKVFAPRSKKARGSRDDRLEYARGYLNDARK